MDVEMSQAEFPMDHNIVHIFYKYYSLRGCPEGSMVKNLIANTGDADKLSNPRLERSPGEGNGYPLQYSCLENPIDKSSLLG